MKWWEIQREMEAHTHECGKCYAEGDCYCSDFAEEVKVEKGGED